MLPPQAPINRTSRCYLQGPQHICTDKAATLVKCPGKEVICMLALWHAHFHTFFPDSTEMATYRGLRLWFLDEFFKFTFSPFAWETFMFKEFFLKKELLAGGLLSLSPSLSQAFTFECCQVIMHQLIKTKGI